LRTRLSAPFKIKKKKKKKTKKKKKEEREKARLLTKGRKGRPEKVRDQFAVVKLVVAIGENLLQDAQQPSFNASVVVHRCLSGKREGRKNKEEKMRENGI
jgi:hypothetical protein